MNMETNIGKTFLKIVKNHFPRNNSFYKISFNCMKNFSSIIPSHNKSILRAKA